MRRSCHPPRPTALPPHGARRRGRGRAGGFTLTELLVVLGTIAILLALAASAITSVNKSHALNRSGRLFTDLLTTARSEAIARRTIVRVEVAMRWPADPTCNYRKLVLTAATLSPDGSAYTYQQIGKWETLDDGVVFEVNEPLPANQVTDGSVYLLAVGATTPPLGDKGALTHANDPGQVDTVYVAFSSTGALVEQQPPAGLPVPVRARLVEGTLGAATSVNYTRRGAGDANGYPTSNWLDVRVDNFVGRIEVGRPETPLPMP